MGWVEKREKHYCHQPINEIAYGDVEAGSLWKCDDCYALYSVERVGSSWDFVEVATSDRTDDRSGQADDPERGGEAVPRRPENGHKVGKGWKTIFNRDSRRA